MSDNDSEDTKSKDNNKVNFETNLSPENEVPKVTSGGEGKAEVWIDRENNRLSWNINYDDLSGPVTAAHFHGPAKQGENAAVIIPIEGELTNPIKGESVVTKEMMEQLTQGKWYINIHTNAYPDGEIRGQLIIND